MTSSSEMALGARRSRALRSVWAVLAAFVTVFVLSLATDQVLHVLQVYPPWGQPMFEPGLNLLALSYRILYTLFGGYLAARLAPHSPMRHAWALGFLGLFIGALSVIATAPMNLGPSWYPVAIAASAVPCSWAGGLFYQVLLLKSRRSSN